MQLVTYYIFTTKKYMYIEFHHNNKLYNYGGGK
jgi:hypothetical protein